MNMKAGFEVEGVAVESRVLKSDKSKDWRMMLLKVATVGITLEIECPESTRAAFEELGAGDPVRVAGRFEQRQGSVKFIASAVSPVKAA